MCRSRPVGEGQRTEVVDGEVQVGLDDRQRHVRARRTDEDQELRERGDDQAPPAPGEGPDRPGGAVGAPQAPGTVPTAGPNPGCTGLPPTGAVGM